MAQGLGREFAFDEEQTLIRAMKAVAHGVEEGVMDPLDHGEQPGLDASRVVLKVDLFPELDRAVGRLHLVQAEVGEVPELFQDLVLREQRSFFSWGDCGHGWALRESMGKSPTDPGFSRHDLRTSCFSNLTLADVRSRC